MRTWTRSAGAALVATLAVATGAPAASAGTGFVDASSPNVVHYDASSGQDNTITVDYNNDLVTITDSATASPTAGSGCMPDSGALRCTPGTQTNVIVAVTGGDGTDKIIWAGGTGSANFDGGTGGDLLLGGPGDDVLDGGPDTDIDTVAGFGGSDRITATGCGDLMYAGPGNDSLYLSGGNSAYGQEGDDRFFPRASTCAQGNKVDGGAGNDLFDARTDGGATGWSTDVPAIIALDRVANDGPLGAPRSNIDVENIAGGPETDFILGGNDANTLSGGDGDDFIDGGPGDDQISGGAGEDLADYSSFEDPVNVSLDGAANDGTSGEHDNVGTDVEDIAGGDGNDTLTGSDDDNVLDGGPGADTMSGRGGFDVVDYSVREARVIANLDGSAGNDGEATEGDSIAADVEGLVGGDAGDVLTGNSSSGILLGFGGNDVLTDTAGGQDFVDGGDGADTIAVRDSAADDVSCGAGSDSVTADPQDSVDRDCESVVRGTPPPPASPDTIIQTKPPAFAKTRTPSFTFASTIAGSGFQCRVDAGPIGACTSPFTVPAQADGRHVFTVVATSPAGVTDLTPATVSFGVDTAKPTISVKLPKSRCAGSKGITLNITAKDAAEVKRIQAKLGKKLIQIQPRATMRLSLSSSQLHRYGKRVRLQVTDSAGNLTKRSVYLKRCAVKKPKK